MSINSLSMENYQKLIEKLNLDNNSTDQDMEFFNAWNFGQSEDAGEYITVSHLVMNEDSVATSENCHLYIRNAY